MNVPSFITALAAAVTGLGLLDVGVANAAVSYRSKTCGQSASGSITMTTPAGAASGDVLVASMSYAGVSGTAPTPSGWTQVPSLRASYGANQELVTWYRVLSAAPAANYSFPGGSGADVTSGSITAFRGVDPTAPIAGTPAQTIVSSLSTSGNFPNSSGTRVGSMRYSAIGIDDGSTTTFGSGLTALCVEDNESGSDASIGTAYESTGIGTTATRSFNLDDNGHLALQTFVLNALPCNQGGLNLAAPSAVSFGSHALTGADGTRTATPTFTVDDQTGTFVGWNLSATSTTFTNGGGQTLPIDATTFTGVTPTAVTTAGEARCSAPTSGVTYPLTLPANTTAPAAVKIYNASANTGRGGTQLAFNTTLEIPARTRIGAYTSTWTFTLATGP